VDQSLNAFHVLLHPPGLATKLLTTPQLMNASFEHKIWDLHRIPCEGTLEHGATRALTTPDIETIRRVAIAHRLVTAMVLPLML
jgi:hypothetical protein